MRNPNPDVVLLVLSAAMIGGFVYYALRWAGVM